MSNNKSFKVWVEIEVFDPEIDPEEPISASQYDGTLPEPVATFESMDDAYNCMMDLVQTAFKKGYLIT